METQIIKVQFEDRNLKFDKILKKNGFEGLMPSNSIINKVRPSFGATHCELNAQRNSIIIEPFISVMEVKQNDAKKYPVCIVNGDIKDEEIVNYLSDVTINFNKIMTTPESFGRLINILKKIDKNYRENYFLLYDECEKLVQYGIFRPKLQLPLDELFKFKNKALITATPLIPSDARFDSFKFIEFKPTFNYKKDLKLIITNNLRTSFRNQLRLYRDNRPVFVFTNCKKSILYGTQLDLVKSDFKVFCAKDLDEEFFKSECLNNVDYSVKNQQYAKYNFFTSRFFSAVDMYLPGNIKPHIIILTDLPFVKHSIIDPFTDAIQILGRLRSGFKTITHITKLFLHRDELTEGAIEEEVNFNVKLVTRIQQAGLDYKNSKVQQTIDALVENNLCSSLVDEEFTINSYALDAIKYKLKVENYYTLETALMQAYQSTNYFNVELVRVSHLYSEEDKLKLLKARGKSKRRLALQLLLGLDHHYLLTNRPLDEDYFEQREEIENQDEFVADLYDKVDATLIWQTGFILSKMKKLYFDKTLEERESNLSNMIDEILFEFKLNVRYYSKDVKAKLQEIYNKNSYFKDASGVHNAKAGDILKYFEGKYIEPKKPSVKRGYETYFILTSKKYSFSKDLELLN